MTKEWTRHPPETQTQYRSNPYLPPTSSDQQFVNENTSSAQQGLKLNFTKQNKSYLSKELEMVLHKVVGMVVGRELSLKLD